jgi:predicted short-subunit dehydrogenase-like oxidoreductase (DUF2520 family)
MVRRSHSLNVSVVGAGPVGTALGLLLRRKGYRIVSVISRRRASARKTASLLGCTRFSHRIADIHPQTDFLLITTSEESVHRVAEEASRIPLRFSDLVAAHTSGFLTSDELRPLRKKGALVLSLHPMQSFPRNVSPVEQLQSLRQISYGVEGSSEAMTFARRMVRKLGGRVVQVPKEQKISYHLACVFASNYSVALLDAVSEVSKGFVANPRLKHFRRLIESGLENALRLSPRKALTGPISRGSITTVRAHIGELKKRHPRLESLYKAMGLYALEFVVQARRISPRKAKELRKLLRK